LTDVIKALILSETFHQFHNQHLPAVSRSHLYTMCPRKTGTLHILW